jgi:tyrosine-protein phosphatase
MQLPPFAQHGEQKFSERLSQSLHDLKEEDPSYDLPESQEKKEDGYPNGPVCIYDCGVYLYLEPSREEASKFDCVINVAKEVLCPFISASDSKGKESTITSVMRHGHAEFDRHAISEPQTAVSEFSFKSAFEYQPLESPSTPTTPKPEKAAPEYVHIPWDHNSDIVEDAYLLCKIIDKRVNDGKKVLVHCQLGVSRSASLIIAYGMYKNSSLDFSMAYEHVKSRSQWISPNMTLIYQLTEFRNKLNIGAFEANPRSAPSEWFKFGEAVRTPKAIPLEVAQESESASSKTVNRSKPLPPIPKFDQVMTDSFSSSSASSTGALTPTPSTTSSATQTDPSPFFPRPFLLRERASAVRPLNLSLPPRPEYGIEMDLVANDVPESPSMFSPRAAEFTASPFHRTAAGDLALHRVETVALPEEEDPRSPPQHGDASITRSIDEFL